VAKLPPGSTPPDKLLSAWVNGSNQKTAVTLKQAAKEELGLQGMVWNPKNHNITSKAIDAARGSTRQMYEQTQAYFQERGITHVTLYRGVKTGVRTPSVLESWTTNKSTAYKFDGHDVMEMRVPVERIFMHHEAPNWKNGRYGQQWESIVMPGPPRS
jgi:hypothetical protein